MSGHAILIGHQVAGWQADLQNVENWLRRNTEIQFSPTNITRIENGNATSQRIKETIRSKGSTLTADDFLVIYYSGHGMERRVGPGGDPDGFCQVINTQDGVITDREFWDLWTNFKDNVRVLFITDCCHSEGVASTLSPKVPVIALAHLSACMNNQESRGNAHGGRFTNAIINAHSNSNPANYVDLLEQANLLVDDTRQKASLNVYGALGSGFREQRPLIREPLISTGPVIID